MTSTSTTSSSSLGTVSSGSGSPWQELSAIPVGGPYTTPGPGGGTGTPGVALLSLAIDPTNPKTLFAEAYSQGAVSLSKSADGGTTWSALSTAVGTATFSPGSVSVDPTGNVFVSSDLGLVKSSDGGATWNIVFPASSGWFGALVIIATAPPTLYGLGDQLRTSTDGGATWSTLNSPSGFAPLGALAVAPASPSVLYATANPVLPKGSPIGGSSPSSAPGGVFKSTDGGQTWTTVQFGSSDFYSGLSVDGSTPTNVYAIDQSSSTGTSVLLASRDAGVTWTSSALPATPVPTGRFILAAEPRSAGTLYVGAVTAVSLSTNGGATWTDASAGLGLDTINQLGLLVADPTASLVLYASGVQGGAWKTTSGGR
jgi:photosystem II stability/assembly factor-like uncharacterized protein